MLLGKFLRVLEEFNVVTRSIPYTYDKVEIYKKCVNPKRIVAEECDHMCNCEESCMVSHEDVWSFFCSSLYQNLVSPRKSWRIEHAEKSEVLSVGYSCVE
jgi:hypothetical protein